LKLTINGGPYPVNKHSGALKRAAKGWILLCCIVLRIGTAHAAATVSLCVDDNFPPFEYADPAQAMLGKHIVRGATIRLIDRILHPLGISYRIEWSPFLRCLENVKQGTDNIGLDAYYDPLRSRQLDYSAAYLALTPQYYYSRRVFPRGLAIRSAQDLKKYRGCGILGYSYLQYGLKPQDLSNTESHDDDGLIRMIQYRRCDYFVEELEVMQGLALTGKDRLHDPEIGHGPVPGASAPKLYFFLTRDSTTTRRLLPILNREIYRLTRLGVMRDLVDEELSRHPLPERRRTPLAKAHEITTR